MVNFSQPTSWIFSVCGLYLFFVVIHGYLTIDDNLTTHGLTRTFFAHIQHTDTQWIIDPRQTSLKQEFKKRYQIQIDPPPSLDFRTWLIHLKRQFPSNSIKQTKGLGTGQYPRLIWTSTTHTPILLVGGYGTQWVWVNYTLGVMLGTPDPDWAHCPALEFTSVHTQRW